MAARLSMHHLHVLTTAEDGRLAARAAAAAAAAAVAGPLMLVKSALSGHCYRLTDSRSLARE